MAKSIKPENTIKVYPTRKKPSKALKVEARLNTRAKRETRLHLSQRLLAKQIGVKIKDKRQQAGLTQRELAIKANIGQSHISHIEGGTSLAISTKTLVKLCTALHMAALFLVFDATVQSIESGTICWSESGKEIDPDWAGIMRSG